MKYLRKFDSVSDMETAIENREVAFIGLAYNGDKADVRVTATPPGSEATPFYVEDVSGSENTVKLQQGGTAQSAPQLTIEKSLDGINWETIGTTSTSAISATVPANGKLYLRCKTTTFGAHQQDTFNRISCTNSYKIGGNIMSLLYGNEFTGNETQFPENSTYTFYKTFYGNNKLTDCSKLLLPNSAVDACYHSMFYGCTSLTTAPTILPATTLATECYKSMFYGCTKLTTSPELPATTLANSCYSYMFQNCTSLTTAPDLPATTLVRGCYTSMFEGCTKLSYIKCLATNTTEGVYRWVYGVSSTGTFVKDASADWTTGTSGIPSGWTVQNAQ